MSDDLLVELLQELNSPQHLYNEFERYFNGTQALAYISPEARVALGNRIGRIASNIPRLAVNSLAERLRIVGFHGTNIWRDWIANDLDQQSSLVHRDALLLGDGYLIVWSDPTGGPRVSVESPKQVAVICDPGSREITSAVKRWRTKTETFAVKYLPDRVERWRANTAGAATAGFDLIDVIDNPLGEVPVVNFRNAERVGETGHSEVWDLMPLVDGLNKTLADMAVAQEFTARPRRWATGIELVEVERTDSAGVPVMGADGQAVVDVQSPIPEGSRAMLSESPDARFGQLDGANLSGFEASARLWLAQIMAVSALPAHFVGITTENPSSAEALRASESSLTARAEARQQTFGRAWERTARLMVAVRDGVDPSSVTATVAWGDPGSRSLAAAADAGVKLHQAGILSRQGVLKKLGYSEQEIREELANAVSETSEMSKARVDPISSAYYEQLVQGK